MKIVPTDIVHKTFSRKMMGYDQEEVTDFLRRASKEFEQLIDEKNTLRESIREKELSIIEYRERDELLKNTITTATKMSDRIHMDAKHEANRMLDEASQKANSIVHEAKSHLESIYREIEDLTQIRTQFENNLRALIESHMNILEQGRQIMPDPLLHQERPPRQKTFFHPELKEEENQREDKKDKKEEEIIKENVHHAIHKAIGKEAFPEIPSQREAGAKTQLL